MSAKLKRREFITLLGGAAAAWPLAVRAQQRERIRRIGVLIGVAGDAETKAWVATFRKRLEELGWQAGRNVEIDERWTATRNKTGSLLPNWWLASRTRSLRSARWW
jgi:putative tryptophan/tyrosine transport system substrate-binding protein